MEGCSESCSIRPCLEWIKTSEAQANATLFLAKFYGRAGLLNLINAGPIDLRPDYHHGLNYKPNYGQEDEEEEDLSMVSDASSGPPNFRYDYEEENVECYRKTGFYSTEKVDKNKVNDPRGKLYRHSCLDDTASSTNKYDPSNNQPGFVNGVKQGSFGFWKSANSKRQDQGEPSLFRGRRRG